MFDSNCRLYDSKSRALYIEHMRELTSYGYAGFELHVGRSPEADSAFPSYADEVKAYAGFRRELDVAGLREARIATNVGATPDLDPSSGERTVREAGLKFLRSRIDITAELGGEIMMGPVVVPYGAFVRSAPNGDEVWSDKLQMELEVRYQNAAPVLQKAGEYAKTRGVKIAIEPITHWETPGPNTLAQLLKFLGTVPCTQVGAIIDSAHEVLDGAGPAVFSEQVKQLSDAGRLHYAQASPPDRGGLGASWVPWRSLFEPLLSSYSGPVAIEIFNAVPDFAKGLRLSRRKYWVPGVDASSSLPSAYEVAKESLQVLRSELSSLPCLRSLSHERALDPSPFAAMRPERCSS